MDHKVEWVQLSGGKSVPAYKLICPDCNVLDLETDIDTTTEPWTAYCSKGHEFKINSRADA